MWRRITCAEVSLRGIFQTVEYPLPALPMEQIFHYPPDRQEKTAQTILQQAELLCGNWAAE